MQSRYRLRARHLTPLAAAVLGSAALAPSAIGAVANPSHIIEVVQNTSDITIGGVDTAEVELRRNGVVIGTGTATGAAGGGESGLNSDHVPGGCWDGFVPQMLPGDEVHNTTNGDFITLGQVEVTEPIHEENGAVVFRGTFTGPLPAGHELDATIDPATDGFRWADGSSGGQFLSAGAGNSGGSITVSGNTWTARFTGLAGEEKAQALGGHAAASVGIEHDVAATGGEVTAWHFGEVGGGFGGCTEPYRPNEVTGFDRAAINASNAGSDLVVNGVSQPGVDGVAITLTDSAGDTATGTATPSGNAWSSSIDASGLADGPVNATIVMSMGADDFAGVGDSITKDTVAPGAPTASVAPGTYQQAQSVALTGQNVRYTTDGSTPTASSPAYGSALLVNQSQTIRAVSVDGAGNLSSVASFAYTIQPPPAAAVTPPAGNVPAPVVIGSNVVAPAPRLSLSSLVVARRMTLGSARRKGISARFVAPNGANAVRVRLRRGRKTIGSVVRRVRGGSVVRVTLPGGRKARRGLKRGKYTLQITPGSSTSNLNGVTSSRTITLG